MSDKDNKNHTNSIKKDNDLWMEMTKDVLPLKNSNEADILKKPLKMNKYKNNIDENITKDIYTPKTPKSNDVDHRTHTRLKRGKMQIEGRLDLHGMTQNQAYDALLSFIPRAHSTGKRCMLVITGKGGRQDNENIGILKQKTPEWLNSPPLEQYVLKIEDARPNHGGAGALYVLLRRKR